MMIKVAIVQSPNFIITATVFSTGNCSVKKHTMIKTPFSIWFAGKSGWNAAYWIGTNALMRREAILSIGGSDRIGY